MSVYFIASKLPSLCKATTKSGKPCLKHAGSSGLCGIHTPKVKRCHAILECGWQCAEEIDSINNSSLCTGHYEIVMKDMSRDGKTVEQINQFRQSFAKIYPEKRLPDVEAVAYSERVQKLFDKYPRLSIEGAIRFVYEGKKLPLDEIS
jgi:hypothetical protein